MHGQCPNDSDKQTGLVYQCLNTQRGAREGRGEDMI